MRIFNSYGPVDPAEHYCVERKKLVDQCAKQLVGNIEKEGHYFPIWGPRQTGKTWLYRQSLKDIKHRYGEKFIVGEISMQGITFRNNDDPTDVFFNNIPVMFKMKFSINSPDIQSWLDWKLLFSKDSGIFDRPLILAIDEFDKLPQEIINNLISLFREMYLDRQSYMLHGLALVGVRAVLGVESTSGSPFNIQRSLHVENLSFDEVKDMFDQYQKESAQQIEPDVIEKLYQKTQGQPGLIGWFGELLTDKYNQEPHQTLRLKQWHHVYNCACEIEHNNTVLNIITKARNEYKSSVIKLFTDANIHFSFDYDWCNYMYMHGIISYERSGENHKQYHVCRFSSPFIQTRLYNAFIGEIKEAHDRSMLALDPLDALDDVTSGSSLKLPALLNRYKDYLARLKDNGLNPWQDQPRRKSDYHLTEAVGHFHLYHWLQMALGIESSISPEFPTGNGKVDLHIIYEGKKGIIEVKSFTNLKESRRARKQAAAYAKQTGYPDVTIAMFAPFTDENVLNQLSVSETIDNIDVHLVVIGQG
ncbi:ATPase domain protein, prokaryote domain protein [Candidatus Magnetomorum sp. HK-1]|nr:ATPase domain protein, prokaryote domain protein [Candidatus Magnetomorum sp. HK-1]